MQRSLACFSLLLALGLLLGACASPRLLASPTPPPTPSATFIPIPTLTATPLPSSTPTPLPTLSFEMNCTPGAVLESAAYRAENNTWGMSNLTGWSQCIGLGEAETPGMAAAQWTWDWLDFIGGVKAYPEIIFGQKPGMQSTTPDLPRRVNQISSLAIRYDITSTSSGTGNLAFDIWLTDSDNPDTFGAPPITHEIMIWLEGFDGMQPGGSYIGKVTIGGIEYHLLVGEHFGDGWTYLAFKLVEPRQGVGELELVDFLDYLKTEGRLSGDEYVASIEFGNEVVNGAGQALLRSFEVVVR